MSNNTISTRRSFLKNGALLAAPLAAAAPAAVLTDNGLKVRLAKLEDEAAIRDLHQVWLQRVNAGEVDAAATLFGKTKTFALGRTVRSIAPDHTGEPDAIVVGADGRSATGRFHCAVEIGIAIPLDCTLAQMAHQQGGGFVCRTERRVLKVRYAKASGGWSIAKAEFAPA